MIGPQEDGAPEQADGSSEEGTSPEGVAGANLSEIASIAGHFLSDHRERLQDWGAAGGRARPVRLPPGSVNRPALSEPVIAPAAESHAVEMAAERPAERPAEGFADGGARAGRFVPVWAVVRSAGEGVGVSGEAAWVSAVVAQVSRSLRSPGGAAWTGAGEGGGGARVGVIGGADDELRLGLFDPELPGDVAGPAEAGSVRELTQAAGELHGEVDAWVVTVGADTGREDLTARLGEAMFRAGRSVPAGLMSWVVLVEGGEAGEAGMVSAYRVIKSLAGVEGDWRPRLVLACAGGDALVWANKLRGVMRKFLQWDAADAMVLTTGELVSGGGESAVHELVQWQGEADDASLAELAGVVMTGQAGWAEAADQVFADQSSEEALSGEVTPVGVAGTDGPAEAEAEFGDGLADVATAGADAEETQEVVVAMEAKPVVTTAVTSRDDADVEVIELTGLGVGGVVEAVVRGYLAEGQTRPLDVEIPGLPEGRLCVDGEGRLLLIAAMEGDEGLSAVGRGLTWAWENAGLIGRACGAEVARTLRPEVRLLVGGGVKAQRLSGLFAGASVRVQTYRTLRWGTRRGVVVEAA